ncbi:MAG: hypothetical protein HS129_15160 [Leptospiraceae bacterium]|nr:hypothetical protein [Leptospiraceae bacterium]NUM41343.1 hypothetical protein [Leptospiraceae bacterium]
MKQKLDAEEVIKYLAPFIGFYAIAKSTILSGQKKFLFYYLQAIVSGFILIVFIAIFSGGSKKEVKGDFVTKDSTEEASERPTQPNEPESEKLESQKELMIRVNKLKKGNGHDWIIASITEQNIACLDLVYLFLKRDDATEALKICREIDKTYSDPNLRDRPMAEVGVTLGTLIYGSARK